MAEQDRRGSSPLARNPTQGTHSPNPATQPPTYPPTWATVLHNKILVIMGLLPWEAMKSGYVPPATHSGSQQCTHT